MTLTDRLSHRNACVQVGVPLSSWSSTIPCCNCQCRHEFQVTLLPCTCKLRCTTTPTSPVFTTFFMPQSPIADTTLRLPDTAPRLPDPQSITPFTHSPSQIPNIPQSPAGYVLPYLDLYTKNKRRIEEHNSLIHEASHRLAVTTRYLRISGWYYQDLDWLGARSLLKDAVPGTFLIRNSGDKNFIFSLSLQTERGPTSVRLHYESCYFRLDSDSSLARYMPRFRCVVELVQYYASSGGQGSNGTVWVDRDGCQHSPVLLKTPMTKSPPSLLHASRLAIHKSLESKLTPKLKDAPKYRLLPLPPALLDYLGDYPYSI